MLPRRWSGDALEMKLRRFVGEINADELVRRLLSPVPLPCSCDGDEFCVQVN